MRLNRILSASVVGIVALLRLTSSFSAVPVVFASCSAVLAGAPLGAAPAEAKRSFDLPRGDAATTLRQFAAASGRSLVFVTDKVRGETTNAVRGDFTPREAIERMLAGTALEAVQDAATGALIISRKRSAEGEPGTGAVRSVSDQLPGSRSMTSKPRTLLAAVASWLAVGTVATGQTIAPPPLQEEAIVLSPFEVSATSDVGYQARETIAGGRLRTELKDVSSQVDVMTQEFISDLGLNTLDEAFKYSLSVEGENDWYDPSGTGTLGGNPFNPSTGNRARGLSRASTSVGFFETSAPVDSYNTERYSFVNGPNAILFGNGMAGGSIDTSFKRAGTTRNKYSASLQVDSDQGYRASFDLNQMLIKDRLAVRFTTMKQDVDYGRTPSYDRQERSFGTVTLEPYQQVRVRAYYDYGYLQRQPVRATLVQDKVTPYLNTLSPDARAKFLATYDPSVLRGFDNSALNSFSNAANNTATTAALVAQGFAPAGQPAIATRYGTNNPVLVSGGAGGAIPVMSWNNTGFLSNGPGPYFGENSDWSFSDNSIYPAELNIIGNGLQNATRTRIYGGVIELNPAKNLFIEYGFNREFVNHAFTETLPQVNAELLIDLNRYLPVTVASGPLPPRVLNPNCGRYYVSSGVNGGDNENEREDHRVTATYTLDFTKNKGWSRWLGVHRGLGLWTSQMSQRFEQVRNGGSGATVISDNDFTGTVPAAVNMTAANRALHIRHYLGSPTAGSGGAPFVDMKIDPWNFGKVGTDASGRPVVAAGENLPWGSAYAISNGRKESEGTMLSLQSAFLNGRIITNLGRRSDDNTYSNWLARDLQPRYDASTGQYFKPTSPITGTHPLVNAPFMNWKDFTKYGLGEMQNASSRQDENPTSVLQGVVVHPLSWFSLFYNESSSAYAAEFTRFNLDGTPMAIDDGTGKDYGFAVSLAEGKLSLRVNWFESTRVGGNSTFQGNSGASQRSLRDSIYYVEKTFLNVNPGYNISGDAYEYYLNSVREESLPTNVGANTSFTGTSYPVAPNREASAIQADRRAEGIEVTLSANPLPGLSLSIRGAENTTADSDAGIIWFEYADKRWKDWESVANAPMGNIAGQTTTLKTYFQNVILPSMSYVQMSNGMPNPQERKYRVNFTARYSIQQGSLKGVFFGGNYNWRSKSILGFFTRPAEPDEVFNGGFAGVGAGSFEVPDFSQPIKGTVLTSIDAFIGYRRKFHRGKLEWSVQLNIRNLLDDDDFIPQRAFGYKSNGVNQFRFTNYNVPDPRRFILTNTISF